MWTSIADKYEKKLQLHGSCSIYHLSTNVVFMCSTSKTISYYNTGVIVPPRKFQGHGYSGVGVLYGMQMHHHIFIYTLYLDNPSPPVVGYVERVERHFGFLSAIQSCKDGS